MTHGAGGREQGTSDVEVSVVAEIDAVVRFGVQYGAPGWRMWVVGLYRRWATWCCGGQLERRMC